MPTFITLSLILIAAAIALFSFDTSTIGQYETTYAETTIPDRLEHYIAAIKPTSVEQAKSQLTTITSNIIALVQDKEALKNQTLETIHEKSYSLEAAVDYLRAENYGTEEKIDSMDEAIQALHYASENHESEKTLTWIESLKIQLETF